MAALSLLLFLLGAGVVAPEPPQHVVQESVDLQHIQQLLQDELDPRLLPDAAAAAAATAAPSPAWPSTVPGFPPPWPEAAAVTRHCRHRPRPPAPPALPPSAFGHLRRQAAALAALGPRMDSCCARNASLPCARRAWTEVLDAFCADEFGVKTRQFHCCRLRGAARRRCFVRSRAGAAAAAPPRDTDTVPFPPGEPTASNMGNICGLRGLRPGPSGPSGPIARFQLRLERDYGRCCRNGSLECAHDAWRSGLERLCREEAMVKTRQQRCCGRGPGPARIRCFAATAPHPGYGRELHNVSLARAGPALLRALCGPARLLSKRRPVPELLGAITSCCPRPPQEQRACTEEQLGQAITTLCSAKGGAWRDPQRCCSGGDPAAQRRCFDTTYLAQVTMGLAVPPPPPGHEE